MDTLRDKNYLEKLWLTGDAPWKNLVINMVKLNPSFWNKKRVLITGHTGFKGSWLSLWLSSLGAEVMGYALEPLTSPSLFNEANVADHIHNASGRHSRL